MQTGSNYKTSDLCTEDEHIYKSLHEVVLVVVHEDVSQEGIVGEEIETQRPPGPSSLLLGIVCH